MTIILNRYINNLYDFSYRMLQRINLLENQRIRNKSQYTIQNF